MKKTILLLSVFGFLYGSGQNKPLQYTVIVSLKYSSKFLLYKIDNKSLKNVYVAKELFIRKVNDSILLESIDNSELVHYNKFMIPEMKTISPKSMIKGWISIELLSSSKISKSHCYLRIYDRSFKKYLFDKKEKVYYKNDFLKFEKEHSVLIKSNIIINT